MIFIEKVVWELFEGLYSKSLLKSTKKVLNQ